MAQSSSSSSSFACSSAALFACSAFSASSFPGSPAKTGSVLFVFLLLSLAATVWGRLLENRKRALSLGTQHLTSLSCTGQPGSRRHLSLSLSRGRLSKGNKSSVTHTRLNAQPL